MKSMSRWLIPIALTVAVIVGLFVLLSGSSGKTLTAFFPRAVSLYKGSDVRILGVKVGTVQSVTPEGAQVRVVINYDTKIKVPSDAKAVLVAPSVVGDRYVQLTWAQPDSAAPIADGAQLSLQQTAAPLELDQIFGNIDALIQAIGPNGANKDGAVNDLLKQTAANFKGQGAQFHQTITDLGTFTQTLDDNKSAFFDSVTKLEGFTHTLAANDGTVRQFNSSLAGISSVLSGERKDLSSSLKNLAEALTQVRTFVATNKGSLGTTVKRVNGVLGVLVHERAALSETLRVAPLALNNLGLLYDPDVGSLNTQANLTNALSNGLSNPTNFFCALIASNDPTGAGCKQIQGLKFPRAPFDASSTAPMDLSLGGLVRGTE